MSNGEDKHMIVPKEQTATLRKKIHTRPPQVKIPRKAQESGITACHKGNLQTKYSDELHYFAL